MSRCRACNNVMTETEMKRKDANTRDYSDLCSSCLVASVEALMEMDGMVTDIETIQLFDEKEVDYSAGDGIIKYVQQDYDFEDNY
jgi:hypothetical protein